MDPAATRYLDAFYPLPNEPNADSPDTGQFAFARKQQTTENFFVTCVDQVISQSNTLHGSYMYDFANLTAADEFMNKLIPTQVHRQVISLKDSQTFGSNFLNNSVHVGYNRFYSGTGAKPPLAAPYYAVRVTGALFHTQGGLAIDLDAGVMRSDGS